MGAEFEKDGNYAEAVKAYTEALEKSPDDSNIYLYRGMVWSMLGNWNKGILDVTQAMNLSPNNALFYSIRGIMYFDNGEFDKALEDGRRATRLDPKRYGSFAKDMEAEIQKIKEKSNPSIK